MIPIPASHQDEPSSAEQNFKREEALHPNQYLGYNHNALAAHLIQHGAYAVAESELRRAIYLNPFEARFKAHLAWCLHKSGRSEEAQSWMIEARNQVPSDPYVESLAKQISGSETE
jgi:Flp pilus assembly protein TadD